MAQFGVLATMRKAGALAAATLLGGLVLVGATAQAASAAATGIVTGSVTSASSGAPLAGICVYAGTVTGTSGSLTATGTTVEAVTTSSGSYQLNAPVGPNAVKFDPSCGGTVTSNYALQYFLGQTSLSTANPVSVSAITPATSINASLVGGSSVSGTVTAPATTGSSPGRSRCLRHGRRQCGAHRQLGQDGGQRCLHGRQRPPGLVCRVLRPHLWRDPGQLLCHPVLQGQSRALRHPLR